MMPAITSGSPARRGDVDRLDRPLVRMDPAEEEQVVAGARAGGERVEVDAVVDRGHVVEVGWRSASLIAT